ncbi:uncharacterized protein LOC125082228 isoform X2 [Lutra lutra]|nr:uncharacterized protein LOC125082228 isoform X2 [Lutra lutra]
MSTSRRKFLLRIVLFSGLARPVEPGNRHNLDVLRILIFVLVHVEMEVMALAGIQDPKHLALWKCHLPFGDVHGAELKSGEAAYTWGNSSSTTQYLLVQSYLSPGNGNAEWDGRATFPYWIYCRYPTTIFLHPVTDGLSNLFIETLISSSQQAEFSEGPSDMASSPPLPPYNAVICSLEGMNTSRHPPLRNNTTAS